MKNIIILLACICLYNCKEKIDGQISKNVITINPHKAIEKVLLSELVDSVSYIKLETNSKCIMGNIREIIIKKKYVYAIEQTQMQVLIFDKKGKFISKLDKRGKGPDEYATLGPVFISEDEEYIEIIELRGNKSRLLKYSNIKFDLLDQDAFSSPYANSCRRINDTYYFSSQQISNTVNGKVTNADLIVVDNGRIEKALLKKKIATNGVLFSPTTESFTQNRNGKLYASLMFNNTFFELSNKSALPILTIDFDKYGINNSIGFKSTREQMKYLDEVEGLASFPTLNVNNPKILAFSYYFKQNSKNKLYQYLKIKKSNKIIHTKEIENDITEFPQKVYISSYFYAINHEVFYDDNYLVDIISPWVYLKENEVEFNHLGKVRIQDNPIIMLMKLKE